MQEELSIILPCYNPVPDWEKNVLKNILQLKERIPVKELIVVNDGSLQNLNEAVLFLQQNITLPFHYVNYADNRGKGYAIRKGIQKATSPLIIYTDIDFPYTLESLVGVYMLLNDPATSIVIGVKNEEYYNTVPLFRKWVSLSLRKMVAIAFHIKTTDTQCGLKGMKASSKDIWLRGKIDRYLFDLEAIHRASKEKVTITTFPVVLREGVTFSKIPLTRLLKEVRNFITIILRQ